MYQALDNQRQHLMQLCQNAHASLLARIAEINDYSAVASVAGGEG